MLRRDIIPSSQIGLPAFASIAERVPNFRFARSLEEIEPRAESIDPDARAELARSLESRLAPLRPPVAVMDAVRQLGENGVCCVITGQQPGLLGGPLYSLYKALHAIRLARSLTQTWERPVVPIFWNHADDHDIAEVHHHWLLNENFDLQRVALASLSSGKQPISRIVLREDQHRLSAARELISRTLSRFELAPNAIDTCMPREGETFANAFTRMLITLLGPSGLIVIEPDWIRPMMSRRLAQLVIAPLASSLARGEVTLRELGATPAIESATAALLYRVDERGRHALRLGGEGFVYDGEVGSRTSHELAAEIVQTPEAWSPGALLRPLVQDWVFPSVAYIGGWGELAYLAQLGPLRDVTQTAHTAAVQRWSCTLIDTETVKASALLDVTVTDVITTRARGLTEVGETPVPPVVTELRAIVARASKELVALKPALAELDRALASNLPRTAEQMRTLIEKLCEKAERVDANRQGRGKRLVRRVGNTICPRGELQERVLGALPFCARWGNAWIEEMLALMTPLASGHMLVTFETNAEDGA